MDTYINSRFKIEKQLGKGSYGEVLLVSDLYTNEFYALKRCNFKTFPEKHFENEVSILKKINGVCENYMLCHIDSFKDNNTGVMITNYIIGYELLSYGDKHDFDIIFANTFIKQMVQVLHVLKNYNIVHRDIKPGNIIYNPVTNYFTLIDFGLASDGVPNIMSGSLGYMTEVVRDAYIKKRRIIDINVWFRNDIFALGASIFRVLNKTAPFRLLISSPNGVDGYNYNLPNPWTWNNDPNVINLVNMMLNDSITIEDLYIRN